MIKRNVSRAAKLSGELDRIVREIDKTDVRKIILFGSLARGDAAGRSDIDLIIIKKTGKRFLERLESVYAGVRPHAAADILVYTPDEIAEMSQWNSFIQKALNEGKVVYEAG